jgi:hypothetical protein
MNSYLVYFNRHQYIDLSDSPQTATRIVKAETPDEAREIVRNSGTKSMIRQHMGMVHQADRINK